VETVSGPSADRLAERRRRPRLKQLVYDLLEKPPTSWGPRVVQLGIMFIIALNVGAVVVGTVPLTVAAGQPAENLEQHFPRLFYQLEMISVGVFTIEYLLRLWSCTVDGRYQRLLLGRLSFALSPMALVDLFSILPSYFQASGFIAARALRLVRIFRVFKLGRYSVAIRSLNRAIASKRAELAVTVFVIGIVLVLVSTLMYYVENDAQPDKFSSIPATMWWGIVTLTTVGYGDISPVTPLGKLLGGVVSIFGIGIVALPAGILGSAFIQELSSRKEPERCPHCGKEL
jgi:voltage-gated potassium channel